MPNEPQKPIREREHEFVRGVWLWGQYLCRECYRPFYYDFHEPSFAKTRNVEHAAD